MNSGNRPEKTGDIGRGRMSPLPLILCPRPVSGEPQDAPADLSARDVLPIWAVASLRDQAALRPPSTSRMAPCTKLASLPAR